VLKLVLCPRAALATEFGSVTRECAAEGIFGMAKVFVMGADDGELYKVMLVQNRGRYEESKVFMMNFLDSRWSLIAILAATLCSLHP
jgi:hypothetical protein